MFYKVDLSEAYLQVKVNEECSKLLAINTHKGQEFATVYLHDILQRSENNEQHKNEHGFKLGSEKCKFFVKQIKYWGQIIDENGWTPDPERAKAIKNMPPPNNVTNLQAFLGLANDYIIYMPKRYDLRTLSNNLLKKVQWIWSKECKDAFQNLKKLYLLSDSSFAHFDPKKR